MIGCILFHFYIKPQRGRDRIQRYDGCILFHFYIKPQLSFPWCAKRIVVSYSISTSNHNLWQMCLLCKQVVSYSISTSNHNIILPFDLVNTVVSYSISTSNHNGKPTTLRVNALYLIPFLHQTTTRSCDFGRLRSLYLIPFLHQTTTSALFFSVPLCCILFHFYIKPQHRFELYVFQSVVSYSISTSNHNGDETIVFSHTVVSYSISTSNHNWRQSAQNVAKLYLIPFLHQTTTSIKALL